MSDVKLSCGLLAIPPLSLSLSAYGCLYKFYVTHGYHFYSHVTSIKMSNSLFLVWNACTLNLKNNNKVLKDWLQKKKIAALILFGVLREFKLVWVLTYQRRYMQLAGVLLSQMMHWLLSLDDINY